VKYFGLALFSAWLSVERHAILALAHFPCGAAGGR
jgi:hypothetical protein